MNSLKKDMIVGWLTCEELHYQRDMLVYRPLPLNIGTLG